MKPVVLERSVQYYETDGMGCVHHSNYIRWFEEARAHLMREGGFSYEGMEARNIVSPVVRVEVEYKSMARFGDEVQIEAVMDAYTGTRAGFTYTVRDKATGAVRCVGKTSHCFLNDAGRPVSLKKACPEYDAIMRAYSEE